jgi:uncharacterized protein YbcI
MLKFQQEYMGRTPENIHACLVGELLEVRVQRILSAAEQELVKFQPPKKGRDLLRAVRTQPIEAARPMLEALVEAETGVPVIGLRHDVSTVEGVEIVIFRLAGTPLYLEEKTRRC